MASPCAVVEVEVFVCAQGGCRYRSRDLEEVVRHGAREHAKAKGEPEERANDEEPARKRRLKRKRPFPGEEEVLATFDQHHVSSGEVLQRTEAAKKSYKCEKCPFECQSTVGLATHQRTHLDKEKVCGIEGCQFKSSNSYTLQSHEKSHFCGSNFSPDLDERCRSLVAVCEPSSGGGCVRRRHRCLECGATFSGRTQAEVHASRRHLPPGLGHVRCHLCAFRTGHTATLKQHVREIHCWSKNERFNTCGECGYVAKNPRNLKYHTRKNHQLDVSHFREHLCDQCGYASSTAHSLAHHKKRKHGSFPCKKCPFVAASQGELSLHERCAHKVSCPVCRLPLARGEDTLENHQCPGVRGPGEGRQEVLEQLLKDTLKTKDSAMINIRQTKGGSKEYICAECGRSGDQLLMLRRHVIMCHSRFSCPHCDFKTVKKPALAQHVKRRHVYPCLEAGCSFIAESEAELGEHVCSSDHLKSASRHNQLRTKSAICPHCSFIINNANSLQTHIRLKHKDIVAMSKNDQTLTST